VQEIRRAGKARSSYAGDLSRNIID